MSEDGYVNEVGTSGCTKQLLEMRASISSHVVVEKSLKNLCEEDVNRRRMAVINRLEGRLRVLEEEIKMLKGVLLQGVEERTKMMHEIHEDFKTIQHWLLQREFQREDFQIVSFSKDRRVGLLQILCQDSNPLLANRGL